MKARNLVTIGYDEIIRHLSQSMGIYTSQRPIVTGVSKPSFTYIAIYDQYNNINIPCISCGLPYSSKYRTDQINWRIVAHNEQDMGVCYFCYENYISEYCETDNLDPYEESGIHATYYCYLDRYGESYHSRVIYYERVIRVTQNKNLILGLLKGVIDEKNIPASIINQINMSQINSIYEENWKTNSEEHTKDPKKRMLSHVYELPPVLKLSKPKGFYYDGEWLTDKKAESEIYRQSHKCFLNYEFTPKILKEIIIGHYNPGVIMLALLKSNDDTLFDWVDVAKSNRFNEFYFIDEYLYNRQLTITNSPIFGECKNPFVIYKIISKLDFLEPNDRELEPFYEMVRKLSDITKDSIAYTNNIEQFFESGDEFNLINKLHEIQFWLYTDLWQYEFLEYLPKEYIPRLVEYYKSQKDDFVYSNWGDLMFFLIKFIQDDIRFFDEALLIVLNMMETKKLNPYDMLDFRENYELDGVDKLFNLFQTYPKQLELMQKFAISIEQNNNRDELVILELLNYVTEAKNLVNLRQQFNHSESRFLILKLLNTPLYTVDDLNSLRPGDLDESSIIDTLQLIDWNYNNSDDLEITKLIEKLIATHGIFADDLEIKIFKVCDVILKVYLTNITFTEFPSNLLKLKELMVVDFTNCTFKSFTNLHLNHDHIVLLDFENCNFANFDNNIISMFPNLKFIRFKNCLGVNQMDFESYELDIIWI